MERTGDVSGEMNVTGGEDLADRVATGDRDFCSGVRGSGGELWRN